MRLADGELKPSVATTCLIPAVSKGILKAAEKLPAAFVTIVEGVVAVKFPKLITSIIHELTHYYSIS